MIRPTKKPTTWAEIDVALARAEANGAERAFNMAWHPGFGPVPDTEALAAEFERAVRIIRGEADDYAETARRESEAKRR